MPNYRRNRGPGGSFFFTVNLADRRSDLLVREIAALRGCIRAVRTRMPFQIDAWVVLPDHMHCVWTLPENDGDFSSRWRAIHTRFTKALKKAEGFGASESEIWQPRFWEHTIRDDRDYRAHIDYVHFNPVKHGLVPHPAAWALSTFRRQVALGMYDPSWACGDQNNVRSGAGERV